MGKADRIRKLWIFTRTGLLLFEHSFDGKKDAALDSQLFGGFISAVESLSEQISGGDARLESFSLAKFKFHIYVPSGSDDYVLFVVQSEVKADRQVRKLLAEIEGRFRNLFPPELVRTWDGDTTIFEAFAGEVADLFADPVKRMAESFW
ncbi:MAG: hypothetical protein Kow0069_20390 [Promethearchaeota archaeon]